MLKRSMVEVGYELLEKSEADEYISDFYTNLSLDERFVLLEDNNWDLRERQSFDKVHIDMNDVYSEIEEEEKELKEDEEEEEEEEKSYDEEFDEEENPTTHDDDDDEEDEEEEDY